jgi:hypothetical protein
MTYWRRDKISALLTYIQRKKEGEEDIEVAALKQDPTKPVSILMP